MLKNRTSIIDDRGFNQGFKEGYALTKRMERRADWMIREMQINSGKKVLEIGCGTGYISYYIALKTGMQVIGSDLCKPFIEEAQAKYILPNLHYQTLNFNTSADCIDEKFDYIIGNGILHHLYNNLEKTLAAFKKLLQINGKLIFMEPNIYNPYVTSIFKINMLRKWAKLEPDEMAFSANFIYKKLEAAKFCNIKVSYKDFLLPGTPRVLVAPVIKIGDLLEKTPAKFISQSLLICAENENHSGK